MSSKLTTHTADANKTEHHPHSRFTAAVIQQKCLSDFTHIDKELTLQASIEHIASAASQGAQLILLQELHTTPYFCQTENLDYFSLAEPIEGTTITRLAAVAKQFNIVIVCSIFERRAAGVFHNTAVVLEKDGTIAGIYRKMHIPHDPGFCEKYYFTPGDTDGFQPIQTSLGQLGVLVCWDQWFPEAARMMAIKGADILLYPTAIGWDPADSDTEQQRQLNAWTTIQRSHAIANHVPVLVANRVGFEQDPANTLPGNHFWGNSFIVGPQGEWLAAPLSDQQEGPLLAELDLSKQEKLRQIWPYFRDRRIDAYHCLMKR